MLGRAACYDFPFLEGVKPQKRFKAKHFINFNIHENIYKAIFLACLPPIHSFGRGCVETF
jgi:hypothetical protein